MDRGGDASRNRPARERPNPASGGAAPRRSRSADTAGQVAAGTRIPGRNKGSPHDREGTGRVLESGNPRQNPPDEPYIPHATGGCPFERALIEGTGFEIVAFDVNDTEAARAMGRALGWDEGMDLDNGLFAMYTILRRP